MNIVEYDEFRAKIDEVKDACNFLPDVTTDEGYAKSKRVALDVGKILTKVEAVRKEKKAYFLEGGKQVDSQAKSIVAELEVFQLPHKNAYKELDALKKQREQDRKDALESRVEFMRTLAESMADSHSSEVLAAMEQVQAEECLDFYEYTEQALKARNKARENLGELYTKKLKDEQDAIELEKLRKEAAERAQAEREEQIRVDASASADKARIEAEERALKAEQDAKNAAENARLAEVERQENEAKIAEQDRLRRESNKTHIGNIRREAKEALMLIGLDEDGAKAVVLAIHGGAIPHVTINY